MAAFEKKFSIITVSDIKRWNPVKLEKTDSISSYLIFLLRKFFQKSDWWKLTSNLSNLQKKKWKKLFTVYF